MKHWSAEFQPRSLCSFGDGGDSGPGGDSGSSYSGESGGDFFGSDSGYYGTNDSGSFVGSDNTAAPTGGDSWTGSESGGGQFVASDPGSYFGGDTGGGYAQATGGDSWTGSDTGGSFYSGGGSDGGYISTGGYDYGGSPYADYGAGQSFGMDPTGGVDFTGSGMGFGYGPGAGNFGMGNAIGAPSWSTGDFGAYGSGGPTSTGFGPGAQSASIGGPGMYGSPSAAGITGFPGDFNAPPGGAFGMPNSQDVGPQAGPGMIGGPTTTQQGEALNPSLFGPEVAPTTTPVVDPNTRTEVDPLSVFGPEFATNQAAPSAGWFGPSQAQAASRGTDQDIINTSNQISNEQNMFANDFGRTGADMTAYMAATNPSLAQALSQVAAAQQGFYPGMFDAPSPSAQQGFQGVSNAQNSSGAFTSFAGPPSDGRSVDAATARSGYDMLTQQMAEQQSNQEAQPSTQMMDAQALGEQGRAGSQVTADSRQAGLDQLAQQMQAQNDQQDMMTAQEQGEQGKAGVFGVPAVDPATSKTGYDMLAQQMQQLATDFGPNYGPQPQGLAESGQLGRGFESADPSITPGQQQFGDAIPGTQFAAPSRSETETIALRPGEDVISSLDPFTVGVGREAAPLGLWSMANEPTGRPGGSPAGNPFQAGGGPFGPSTGRPGGETSGRPGLSITVGNNQYAVGRGSSSAGGRGAPGYYSTGGAGIAPGAKGAEYGGMYGPGVATGRAGTNTFGVSGREGAYGFYDPATGLYYR